MAMASFDPATMRYSYEAPPPEEPDVGLRLDNSTATFHQPRAARAKSHGASSSRASSRPSSRASAKASASGWGSSQQGAAAVYGDATAPRPSTAPEQGVGDPAAAAAFRAGTTFQLPTDRLMDVVVLRRRQDEQSGAVDVQASAGSFNGGSKGISTSEGSVLEFMRESPLVQLGLRQDGSALPQPKVVHGPGSDTLALKNKLIQNRQMLQEARRRIQMLEDARSNDKERAEMEIAMQVEAVRAEAAVEIRKLKERAKMHEETQKQNNFYMPQGSAVPSFGSSPVGPPSAGSSPERGSPKPAAPEDPRMADRYLALTVEMQQHKLKSKREKTELAKKLEHCFLELRGLKKTRTEMQGEADELKRQLKKSKMDAATWKLAAAAGDRRKADKERWREIKDGQNKPEMVVADKWNVERDGLGNVVQSKTAVALQKELNALKKRSRDEGAVRDELKAAQTERDELKRKLTMEEREVKTQAAEIRRLVKLCQTKGAKSKSPKKKKKPSDDDDEPKEVLQATIEGLSVELEKRILSEEELRVQLERAQAERVRAAAQRDEAIGALEQVHGENEALKKALPPAAEVAVSAVVAVSHWEPERREDGAHASWHPKRLDHPDHGETERQSQDKHAQEHCTAEATDAFGKAIKLFGDQEYTEARKFFGVALEHGDTRVGRCHNGSGLCLSMESFDMMDSALKAFDAAVEADPGNANAWHNRAMALERLGRADEAKADRQRADEILAQPAKTAPEPEPEPE